MDRTKGIAYCGLACYLCNEHADCAGCKSGACVQAAACKNRRCCLEKGLEGCWECAQFPCQGMLVDSQRTRAFVRFVESYGVEKLMDCLEQNEKNGLVYHYPGRLTGDYDKPGEATDIMNLIRFGRPLDR